MIKRGNRAYITDFLIKDLYKYVKKEYELNIPQAEFTKMLEEIISHIMNKILYYGHEYNIPHKLGHLRIKRNKNKFELDESGKVKTNKLKINYKESWNLWRTLYPNKTDEEIADIPNKKLIYYLNDNSHGYYNKFYWDKRSCIVRFHSIYKLEINREWKKILHLLSEQNMIYYE